MALAVVQLTSSALRIGKAWDDFRTAQRIEAINGITNLMLQAAQNLAFERGRSTVALRDRPPVTAENRRFIDQRRAEADEGIAVALERLPAYRIAGIEQRAQTLGHDLETLAGLRQQVNRELALPGPQRDPGLPERWFQSASAVLRELDTLLVIVSGEISALDGTVSRLSAIKLNAWDMRDHAGRDSARLGTAIASGAPLNEAQLAEITDLRARTLLHWALLRRATLGQADPRLAAAMAEVDRVYLGSFATVRLAVLQAARDGSPYPITSREYSALAVPALDTLVKVTEAAVAVTNDHAAASRLRVRRSLNLETATLIAVILLILAMFATVHRRVIAPLKRLTWTMNRLAQGDHHVIVPMTGRYDEIGDMAQAVAVFRSNAIDLEAARREAEAARQKAEAGTLAKSRFLATMSHELRTPLNAILGFSEIIRDETFGPVGVSRYAEYAGDIHQSGHHLLSLINDILDISKIEAGKMEITPQLLELEPVLGSSMRLIDERAERRGLRLELDLEAAPTSIYADERALKQIIFNLLSNSIKFTPPGGAVTVAARQARGGATDIMVADSGIGIPPTRSTGCCSRSSSSTTTTAAPRAAPGWACRWSRPSPSCMAARCRSKAA